MVKIMFVCHGNICRSPMAEFIFKDIVNKNGVGGEFLVKSSATSCEELGNPVYPPAKRELAKHGINCDGKFAVRLKKEDYENYDMFICMDQKNLRNALLIFGNDADGKVKMLLDRDVADPWYSGDFETTYTDILTGCTNLYKKLKPLK